MRSPLLPASLGSLLAFGACAELGGQTGDPGVTDTSSLDPDPAPPGSYAGSSCSGGAEIRTRGRELDEAGPASAPLGRDHLVFLDTARGLGVVDVSGTMPRLVGRLPLESARADLHVVGTRALVSRRAPKPAASYFAVNGYPEIPERAELVVVDLSDPAQPRAVSRVTPEHAPSASFVVTSGGRTRLFVLSTGAGASGCLVTNDPRTRLASYELSGDDLVARGQLDLENDVQYVALAGTDLVVVRAENWLQGARSPAQLSVVSLVGAEDALAESAAVEMAGDWLVSAYADGETLRVVTTAQEEKVHVERYAIGDRSALVRQGDCIAGTRIVYGSVTHGPTRTFLRAQGGSAFSVAVGPDGSCDVRNSPAEAIAIASPEPRVFEIDRDASGSLSVKLLQEADLAPLAETSAQLAPGITDVGYGAQVLQRSASADAGPSVLAVPFWTGATDEEEKGLQLFSFTDGTIQTRGALPPARSLYSSSLLGTPDRALIWSTAGLSRIEVGDLDAPALSAALDASPNFTRLWAFEGTWVRLRAALSDPAEGINVSSEAALFAPRDHAHLELLRDDEDPDLGAPSASLPVHPWAHFVRVGDLLVSLVRIGDSRGRRAEFEVFDLRDPAQPRAAGRLMVPSLRMPEPLDGRLGSYWSERSVIHFCLDCPGVDQDRRALVVPHALVLRSLNEAGEPALQVLDLSDPDAPTLSEPISGEPGERALAAFAYGSSVYVSYRVDAGQDADADLPRSRFYFRRIDLAEPARPRIDAAVQVPGQLVAVNGERLYVRQFVRRSGGFETVLHRLVLRGRHAELRASHSFGGRMAFALESDGAGHLLADLGPALSEFLFEDFYESPATDLQLLDAESLELLGEGRVAIDARRISRHAGRALYSAAEGYVLMDLRDPAAPRFQRYFRVLDPSAVQRAELIGDSVILHDSGAFKRFDASER